jgi:hypothetical protein
MVIMLYPTSPLILPASITQAATAAAAAAAGATIQVLLFAVLAVEIKRKAPTTHTCLEIIKVRWGTAAHLTFLVFCLLTNIIVTSMLILGGWPPCEKGLQDPPMAKMMQQN